MATIHKLGAALSIIEPGDHHNMARCCSAAFDIIHPGLSATEDKTHEQFMEFVAARAWFDAAMSLLPTDRAIRMHRYRGKRSGWCFVTKPMELPELEITKPISVAMQHSGSEFFTMCPLLEAAIVIVALKCHVAAT